MVGDLGGIKLDLAGFWLSSDGDRCPTRSPSPVAFHLAGVVPGPTVQIACLLSVPHLRGTSTGRGTEARCTTRKIRSGLLGARMRMTNSHGYLALFAAKLVRLRHVLDVTDATL